MANIKELSRKRKAAKKAKAAADAADAILLVSMSLQGKVPLSKALSRTNPSALDLVLILAPVAFVLGVNCRGLIDYRFVNRSFNIWKESSS